MAANWQLNVQCAALEPMQSLLRQEPSLLPDGPWRLERRIQAGKGQHCCGPLHNIGEEVAAR